MNIQLDKEEFSKKTNVSQIAQIERKKISVNDLKCDISLRHLTGEMPTVRKNTYFIIIYFKSDPNSRGLNCVFLCEWEYNRKTSTEQKNKAYSTT